jgi:hypothetical protein
MSFNGKIIGPKNVPEFFRGNGIWNLNASASTWLELGRWYFNRTASASRTSVVEGDTFTVTINTVGVPDGTYLYWTTNTISGTITTADFIGQDLNGYVQIFNNTASVSRKMRFTTISSGARQFTIVFRVESAEGPIVASSPVITTNDLASGGTSFTRGTYYVHRFGSSAIFTANKTITADVFLVAGGGGGGDNGGGGGGGGGVRNTTVTIPAGSRWVYIGGGGWASNSGGAKGGNGGDTVIDGIISATGGGGGGSRDINPANGLNGGSGGGGGGGYGGGDRGYAVPGQGNNGGIGHDEGQYSAGGGGGGIGGGGSDGYRSGNAAYGGTGGPGGYFDPGLDGTAEPYAGGGGGARTYYGYNGTDGVGQGTNRGGGGKGGGGRPGTYTPAYLGDTGVCYIRYLIPN